MHIRKLVLRCFQRQPIGVLSSIFRVSEMFSFTLFSTVKCNTTSYRCLPAILIVSLCLGCAEKSEIDLGGKKIMVPVPTGFYPVSASAPHFLDFIRRGYSDDTLVLEYFLTKKDLNEVVSGHSKGRKKSMVVTTPLVLYGQEVSSTTFAAFVIKKKDIGDEFLRKEESAQNERVEINSYRSAVTPVLSSDSKWLGIIVDKDQIIGDAVEQYTHEGLVPVKRVSATIEIHLQDRMMSVGCSTVVERAEDITAVEDACKNWAQNILKDNS